jgi:hypothetical protein
VFELIALCAHVIVLDYCKVFLISVGQEAFTLASFRIVQFNKAMARELRAEFADKGKDSPAFVFQLYCFCFHALINSENISPCKQILKKTEKNLSAQHLCGIEHRLGAPICPS